MYQASSAISTEGSVIYRGDNGGIFYAFQSSGSLKWQYNTGISEGIYSAPALAANGIVYFTQEASTTSLYALRASDGALVWKSSIGPSSSSPAIAADGTLYAVGTDAIGNGVLYAFRSTTVVPPADLIVSALSAPSKSGAGATITVTETTKNQGVNSAGASTTRLYLSTNSTLDAADIVLGNRTVLALAPGATNSGSVSVTIPPGTATGTYSLIDQADADNVVPETNESNNKKTKSIQIGPDLIISSLSAPSSASRGATITVTETTKNQGGGGAGASTTTIYLSKNSTLDATDIPLNSRAVLALAPVATNSGSISVTIPSGTAPGTYYLIAKADANNVVVEVSESNNAKSRTVSVN